MYNAAVINLIRNILFGFLMRFTKYNYECTKFIELISFFLFKSLFKTGEHAFNHDSQ